MKKKYNLIVVGTFSYDIYERNFISAMSQVFDIEEVRINDLLNLYPYKNGIDRFINERDLNKRLYKRLISLGSKNILFWRPTYIFNSLLCKLKKDGFKIVSYNNDDPFNKNLSFKDLIRSTFLWYNYKKCLKIFHHNIFYREINSIESSYYTDSPSSVMLPVVDPSFSNDKLNIEPSYDLVYIGHVENDFRISLVKGLINQNFIKFKLFGPSNWNDYLTSDELKKNGPVIEVRNNDYKKAILSSKYCLGLTSTQNRDTITRRFFEVPYLKRSFITKNTYLKKYIFNDSLIYLNQLSVDNIVESVINNLDYYEMYGENAYNNVVNFDNNGKIINLIVGIYYD